MSNNSIDWGFIAREEGIRRFGYIPGGKDGNSGMSIGAGLDLSKHNKKDLEKLGLSNGLMVKLEPFLLVPGDAARDMLTSPEYLQLGKTLNDINAFNVTRHPADSRQKNPLAPQRNGSTLYNHQAIPGTGRLELTQAELEELVQATQAHELKSFIKAYDKEAPSFGQPHFASLPPDIQTAFASFVFQLGHIYNRDKRKPGDRRLDAWEAAIRGDWGRYIEILFTRFNETDFTGRRMREIFLINRARGLIKECPLGPAGLRAFGEFAKKIPGSRSDGSSSAGSSPGAASGSAPASVPIYLG